MTKTYPVATAEVAAFKESRLALQTRDIKRNNFGNNYIAVCVVQNPLKFHRKTELWALVTQQQIERIKKICLC